MITGDREPVNAQSGDPTWTLVIVLIVIIAILTIILFLALFLAQKQINKLQRQLKKEMSTEETTLLLKYRNLNDRDKAVVNATLQTLSQDTEQPKE